jgi:hypothetical protein
MTKTNIDLKRVKSSQAGAARRAAVIHKQMRCKEALVKGAGSMQHVPVVSLVRAARVRVCACADHYRDYMLPRRLK